MEESYTQSTHVHMCADTTNKSESLFFTKHRFKCVVSAIHSKSYTTTATLFSYYLKGSIRY